MVRYNIFNLIHKALRTLLYDTAQTLQQTYFADTAGAESALEKLNIAIEAFEKHGHHEDNILMPVIEKFDPQTIALFEREHIEDRHMGNVLLHLQKIYHAAQSTPERVVAGSAIVKAFRDYLVFNLQHLQHEETELNKILWDHFTDDEIKNLNGQILASIPPEEMASAAIWILRAINSQEAIEWLKQVKANAPEPVFAMLYELTETHLPDSFREKVQQAVVEEEFEAPVF